MPPSQPPQASLHPTLGRQPRLKYLILSILAAGSTFAPAEEPRMSWLDNGRIRLSQSHS